MGGGDSRAWNPAPGASVTFASDAQAWRALLRDGRGGKLEGRLPGAASPAGDLVDPARQQIMLVSGCAQVGCGSARAKIGASMSPRACAAMWRCYGRKAAACC